EISIRDNDLLADIRLQNLQTIDELRIESDVVSALDLGSLTTVLPPGCTFGCFDLATPNLTTLDLGSLVSTPSIIVEDTALVALSLPQLQTVADEFRVADNLSLTAFEAPLLQSVGDTFLVDDNPLLAELSFPVFTDVGRLEIAFNDGLTALSMPAVTQAISVDLTRNSLLPTFDLSSLATVGPVGTGDDGDVRIEANLVLEDLAGLSALTDVAGDLFVRFNTILPDSAAQGLANVVTVGGQVVITGNGP
ncbi:MAG: hypothetical protein AAF211_30820, partial [Myxococcota bacterium]